SADLAPGRALAALGGGGDELAGTIVRTIRLPRSISAFAVGSLLGLAGVLLQALFRNPLADPFVLGVSGGASVGALAGMLAGLSLGGLEWTATGGALGIGLLVLWMGGAGEPGRLLLSGVVLASACGAVISVLLAIADNGQLRGMVFWLAGDLGWAQHPWFDLAAAGAALLAACAGGRALNVLAAGELRSAVLGLDARLTRPCVFLVAAALTSLAVLAAGPVGFVGLVAPHLVRLALRTSDHRLVAPGAALTGGALLCLADIASRTLAAPRQLPVGAITALIGAPVFLLLLRRRPLR
ncbi:MAG: iron ABC transporter permease, partial [Gammaproteobacteria bacterium]|nr:iron ABC transporter permease [Gammaproteobacteria bacterium]